MHVFGLLLDKGGARTKDNKITVAPVGAACIPDKRWRRSCKIFKDVSRLLSCHFTGTFIGLLIQKVPLNSHNIFILCC